MYHGFSDSGVTPLGSIAYRQAVIDFLDDQMGGRRRDEGRDRGPGRHESPGERLTDGFLRLFMVPGMGHCGGGVGHSQVDWMTPLQLWVEKGVAPKAIIGAKPGTTSTRPHCPYPQEAVYQGGDPNVAASFACREVD